MLTFQHTTTIYGSKLASNTVLHYISMQCLMPIGDKVITF